MEVFRDIQGYEGLYQISDEGNVKSVARDVGWIGTTKHYPECILKPAYDGRGYLFVYLCKEGKAKMHKVHRLVASAFLDNPDNLPQVNHKDEDKTNNCTNNLEWCTCEYNINHGTRNQRVAEANSIPVDMLTKNDELIRQFPSSMEATRWLRNNGYHKAQNANIIQCCKGKLQSCYGFKWRYTNSKSESNSAY